MNLDYFSQDNAEVKKLKNQLRILCKQKQLPYYEIVSNAKQELFLLTAYPDSTHSLTPIDGNKERKL